MRRWESFHIDGKQCGALFRDLTSERLLTRIGFPLDEDELFLVESAITLRDHTWQSMTYRQQPGDLFAAAHRDGRSGETMPGYGEFLLLERMLSTGCERFEFESIADSTPNAPVSSASLDLAGHDLLQLPDGSTSEVLRIDVTHVDTVTSSHWVSGSEVIASDWSGTQSYLRRSTQEALLGVDARLADFVRNGTTG